MNRFGALAVLCLAFPGAGVAHDVCDAPELSAPLGLQSWSGARVAAQDEATVRLAMGLTAMAAPAAETPPPAAERAEAPAVAAKPAATAVPESLAKIPDDGTNWRDLHADAPRKASAADAGPETVEVITTLKSDAGLETELEETPEAAIAPPPEAETAPPAAETGEPQPGATDTMAAEEAAPEPAVPPAPAPEPTTDPENAPAPETAPADTPRVAVAPAPTPEAEPKAQAEAPAAPAIDETAATAPADSPDMAAPAGDTAPDTPAEPAGETAGDAPTERVAAQEVATPAPAESTPPEAPAAAADDDAAPAAPVVSEDTDEPAPADDAQPVAPADTAAEDPAPAPLAAPADAADENPLFAECRALAGPPDAGIPPTDAAAAARRARLIAGIKPCLAAARLDDAPGDVLFLAAKISEGRRDLPTAFGFLERAVARGSGPAETRIGDYYMVGLAPDGENPQKAVEHYRSAAALGDAPGMTTLALLYRGEGKTLPADPARMVELLERAARAGYHFAATRLAETYMTGEGVPGRSNAALGIPDPAKAAEFYTLAAEAGNIDAALELAALYANPRSGLEDNPAEQVRLTRMAAQAGVPAAVAAMGVLYETGRGVAYSPEIAAGIYVKAMETGEVAFAALRAGGPREWDDATARAFQTILQERGLYTAAIDGIVGAGTAAAARALAPD